MATIDPRFICTSDLEALFRDNATGLPLSGGILTFYSDVNRTVLKPIYQLTGTPGNYTYQPLPNPCVLSSAGTFQDALGNNIVGYYYPYTETPDDNTGIQELYYITCLNSGFVPQFVRQGWPQEAASGMPSGGNANINYIPNGQFLSHNNIVSATEPPTTTYTFGSQTLVSQAIAQGGWNFVVTQGSTATFNNSFSTIPSVGGWGMNSFPKTVFNFVCTSIGNIPQTRDLRIEWPDVNKFSAGDPAGTQSYTLFFDAKSNDGNSATFTLNLIYYYGTGGSPSAPVVNPSGSPLATFTVGPSMSFVSQNIQDIVFPPNLGTIGTNGDDYVALSITGPASDCNTAFTDFALVSGNQTLSFFPTQTNDQMLSRGVAGWMPTPNPNGQDLYLPLILTPTGMEFDHNAIGEIIASVNPSITSSNAQYLLCDGSTYISSNYSSIGIPYSRLGNALIANSPITNVPVYGTGNAYATAYTYAGITTTLRLTVNITGSGGAAAIDGNTGWTFTHSEYASGSLGLTSYNTGAGSVITYNFSGTSGSIAAATSGFTSVGPGNQTTDIVAFQGFWQAQFTPVAASSLANPGGFGKYFTINNGSTTFYLWYFFTNEMDPNPGGGAMGIQITMPSTSLTAADVGNITKEVLTGLIVNNITVTTVPAAGKYFIFYTDPPINTPYIVWYQVAGTGSAPAVSGTPIQVTLTGSETTAQVVTKTQLAINSYSYSVPYLLGYFLRGLDSNGTTDIDYAYRYSPISGLIGSHIGTYEFSQFLGHTHTETTVNATSNLSTSPTSVTGTSNSGNGTLETSTSGGNETRPVNAGVNWFIRY